MPRRTQERTVVDAFVKLLEEQDSESLVLEHPARPDQRRVPAYLFNGRSGCILVELTELSAPTPHQLQRARTRRIHKALASVTWPAGSYAVEVLTRDDRKVKNLIASEGFKDLLQAAYRLQPTSGLGADVNAYAEAFYRRDPKYFVADANGILLLSKQSAAGSGIIINGPHDSAQAAGTVTLSDKEGHLLEIATTSRAPSDPDVLESSLEEIFHDTEEAFDYRPACRGILLLDVRNYPAEPMTIESAVIKALSKRWPRINEVVLFVDEPYSAPPPPSGVVTGDFRFWRIRARP